MRSAPVPSWARMRTLGALLAAPRPSEASPRLGPLRQHVRGIQALLPDGTEIATRLAPRKATGPDLMHVVVGARGTLGLITAATLRVQRRQEVRRAAAFKLPTLATALSAARALLVRGGRPVELAVASNGVVSLHTDGPEPLVAAELALAERIARGIRPAIRCRTRRRRASPRARTSARCRSSRSTRKWPRPSSSATPCASSPGIPGGACVIDSGRRRPRRRRRSRRSTRR